MSTTIEKSNARLLKTRSCQYMKGSPKPPSCGFSAVQSVRLPHVKRFAYVDILQNPDIRAELPKYN